jgi:hypothetical protein
MSDVCTQQIFGFWYNNFSALGLGFGFGYKNFWVLGLGFGYNTEPNTQTQNPIFTINTKLVQTSGLFVCLKCPELQVVCRIGILPRPPPNTSS